MAWCGCPARMGRFVGALVRAGPQPWQGKGLKRQVGKTLAVRQGVHATGAALGGLPSRGPASTHLLIGDDLHTVVLPHADAAVCGS